MNKSSEVYFTIIQKHEKDIDEETFLEMEKLLNK